MKPIACVLALAAGCIPTYHVNGVSSRELTPAESEAVLAHTQTDTARIVIEKMSERGFTLVDRTPTARGMVLKLAGNRDYAGATTIGSVFYATLEPADPIGTYVRIVGKPTVNHVESCPSLDDHPCTTLTLNFNWGLTGREEAQVILGVLSEIRLVDSQA